MYTTYKVVQNVHILIDEIHTHIPICEWLDLWKGDKIQNLAFEIITDQNEFNFEITAYTFFWVLIVLLPCFWTLQIDKPS